MQDSKTVHPLGSTDIQNEIQRHGKQVPSKMNETHPLESSLTKKVDMIDCCALLAMPVIFIITFIAYFAENTTG